MREKTEEHTILSNIKSHWHMDQQGKHHFVLQQQLLIHGTKKNTSSCLPANVVGPWNTKNHFFCLLHFCLTSFEKGQNSAPISSWKMSNPNKAKIHWKMTLMTCQLASQKWHTRKDGPCVNKWRRKDQWWTDGIASMNIPTGVKSRGSFHVVLIQLVCNQKVWYNLTCIKTRHERYLDFNRSHIHEQLLPKVTFFGMKLNIQLVLSIKSFFLAKS